MAKKNLFSSSFRLQGTDGIRSEARRAKLKDRSGPIRMFVERGIITDQFMELYVYAWARNLENRQLNNPKKSIIVGWDPRDTEGVFSRAVIRGIRKAGATALVAEVVRNGPWKVCRQSDSGC